jgi:hypothetical protein
LRAHARQKIADQHYTQDKIDRKWHSELGPISIVNGFQAVGMLIVQPQSQTLKLLKHFNLAFKEEKSESNENSHQQ